MKKSDLFLFEEVSEKIRNYIKGIEVNASVGSERELAELFNVSRPTIRKALNSLEEEGAIYKVPNKGYFKNSSEEKYVDHELNTFIGFFEDATSQEKNVSSKIIQQTVITGDKEVAKKLQVNEDKEIFVLERLRFIENEPICLVLTYIVLDRAPSLLSADFSKESLYQKLEEENIKLTKAHRSIEIKRAKVNEQSLLNLAPNEPIMLFESLGFLKDGTPIEYTKSRYPGFKVKFETEVDIN